ncbi:MAG: AIR synthase-related protein, partial [Candidatus Omnitrophica bacterium]|nr:AIR synthase-related protein [Candidatus Omnitrophota bacterium]
LSKAVGNSVPRVRVTRARKLFNALSKATDKKLVKSAHDCSEGGLGVALAEMSFAAGLGAEIFLSHAPYLSDNKRNDFVLFSESNSRFVVEVERSKQKDFERTLKGLPFGLIGCVSSNKYLKVYGLNGEICVNADIDQLKEAWRSKLKW